MPFNVADKYKQVQARLNPFVAHATANMSRLGLTQSTIDTLTAQQTEWDSAWAKYTNPDTQTENARDQMATAYKDLFRTMRLIRQFVKANFQVKLTNDDYSQLGIHRNKQRLKKTPIPTVAPENHILDNKQLVNTISTKPPDAGDRHRRRLPDGIARIAREVAVTDTGEPPARSTYQRIDSIGKSVYNLVWTSDQADKYGWLITKYENSVGKTGPESKPLLIRIL